MKSRSNLSRLESPAEQKAHGPLLALLWIQSVYFLVTGIWPLVDVDSFQAVTGPKTDLWLVRTVGVLITAIGLALVSAALRRRVNRETFILATASALALAAIDVIYVSVGRITRIYLADAALEAILIAGWLILYAAATPKLADVPMSSEQP